jgi:F-type H+-transporting ATPase subunit b
MQVDWWTLALQTVNVLVLIWLLARFLFRPVADIVARRQQEANKLLTDAAALKQDTEQARAEMERVRATFVKEREQIIAEAHAAAEAARAALLAQTDDEVTKRRAQADAAIAQDRVAMEKALIDAARELSIEIARRLLQRAAPAASLDAFLPGLSQQVQALSAQERAVFTSNDSRNHPVEVVTACALST